MKINIPEFSMVLMVGPTSSGKSTWAHRRFSPTEIVASDECRAIVSDNPQDQAASADAFELLHHIAEIRLRNRRLVVVDATNLQGQHRKKLTDIARENDCPMVAIVMATALGTCLDRNRERGDRMVGEHAVRNQHRMLRQSIRGLRKEGVHRLHVLDTPEEADGTEVTRIKMRTDLRDHHGPFDLIGDIHGCHDELMELLLTLGYETSSGTPRHPDGRQAIFLGDLVDRGPGSDLVLETAMRMTEAGTALCIAGNHENKLMRKLRGNSVRVSHGLAQTLEQIETRTEGFREQVKTFLNGLAEHYVLDDGKLAVAHAGILEEYQGRVSWRVRSFCLYGQTNGETDEWGLPVRTEWAMGYRGQAMVVYGHTPVDTPTWLNNTICLDTGCVFGGSLTALRYPERELVSVKAARTYYEPVRPTGEGQKTQDEQSPSGPEIPAETAPHALNATDVTGRQEIQTRTRGNITVSEKQTAAALETMSRYAMDPRWLVYLPPTISPSDTSDLPGILEHPAEALAQYREDGVGKVICEEKHMGSRGILILGRDPEALRKKFGITEPNSGVCYTRTGRRFFNEPELEAGFMLRARRAMEESGMWEELDTNWVLMDCEIMPWSLKAHRLIQRLYAPTGAAAVNTMQRADDLLAQAGQGGVDTGDLASKTQARLQAAMRYREAYQHYCWETSSLDDVRVAPFHILAAEGRLLTEHSHEWHMETAEQLHLQDPRPL